MNLALVANGAEVIDLYQSPTEVTLRAIRSGSRDLAFETYATHVREMRDRVLADDRPSWDHDELKPDEFELHLGRVSAFIAFAGARFVVG